MVLNIIVACSSMLQMSFFDPVYQRDGPSVSDDGNESEGLAEGIPRTTNPPQAHEDPMGDVRRMETLQMQMRTPIPFEFR